MDRIAISALGFYTWMVRFVTSLYEENKLEL